MAYNGNKNQFYLTETSSGATSYTWVRAEQTSSFSRSSETIEITDKSSDWAQFIAGKRSATAEVTVYISNESTDPQSAMIKALHNGSSVACFCGQLKDSAPAEGEAFTAIITAINDTYNQGEAASRTISLQVTGEPVHYPTLS